ncbi:hypothetical protein L1987_32766 [Smallanthus sonchifolius]|uniref:Uncharacterized protein n=1 Tax=Smallanthus sonchifolius TaxID=185202 RepID=A0ACB9HP51_9ASTR|nr:hypothetical protein L1987_32766 [Smallanthus sonchifolius]
MGSRALFFTAKDHSKLQEIQIVSQVIRRRCLIIGKTICFSMRRRRKSTKSGKRKMIWILDVDCDRNEDEMSSE